MSDIGKEDAAELKYEVQQRGKREDFQFCLGEVR